MKGRPTKYSDEMVEKARFYIGNHRKLNDAVPSIVGLACFLEVSRSTVYLWAEEEPAFSDILEEVQTAQERQLLTGGLDGDFNSAIVKLMLGKHGYHDKQDVEQNIAINIGTEWNGV